MENSVTISAYLLGSVELVGQLLSLNVKLDSETHLLEQLGKLLVDSQVHHGSVLHWCQHALTSDSKFDQGVRLTPPTTKIAL